MSSTKPSSAWSDIAATKRSELTASIPSEWRIPTELLPAEDQQDVTEFPKTSGFFTDKELDITSTPAIQLLEKVRKQTWTALEVAQAFCKKAAVAHQLVWPTDSRTPLRFAGVLISSSSTVSPKLSSPRL